MLPAGSIVTLKDKKYEGEKYIILSYLELYEHVSENKIGYFEYVARLYPYGECYEKTVAFNIEDIDEIIFTGYLSDKGRAELDELEKLTKEEYDRLSWEEIKKKDDESQDDDNSNNHDQEESILSQLFNL